MKHLPDLTGQTFGYWTVIEKASTGPGNVYWICRCNCGAERSVVGWALRAGKTKSCGCRRAEVTARIKTTHGATRGTKHMAEYGLWQAMRQRCDNPNNERFADYGGRGIKVCDRWRSFDRFLADMGRRPVGMTLDRIDNGGDYSPTNCRWATWSEQARNSRKNRLVLYKGVRMPLIEAAERSGLDYSVVHARTRLGWPEDKWFIPKMR